MDYLPDHVLIEIFNLLPPKDLKELVNVCERWSTLIRTSAVLMRNLPISMHWERSFIKEEFLIDVPLDKANYESLFIRFHKWRTVEASQLKKILSVLAAHEHTVKRLKLDYFKHPDLFGFEFKNVTHLEIGGAHQSNWIPKFDNLTHLVMAITRYEDIAFLKTEKFNLKHFSVTFNLERSFDVPDLKVFFDFILRHIDTLQELKIIGLTYDEEMEESITKIVGSEKLRFLHIDLPTLIRLPNYVATINNGKKWTQIDFINSLKEYESEINSVIGNFPHVKRVRFEQRTCKQLELSIFKISNVQVATYVFDGSEAQRDVNQLAYLHEVVISHIGNEYQMSRLIELLRHAKNLKILRIKNLWPCSDINRNVSQLPTVVKDLEELYLEPNFISLQVSQETVQVIYDLAKNLKRLTIVVDREKLAIMKERLRIFDFTKVKAVAIEKEICISSRMEKKSYGYKPKSIYMNVSFSR